MKSIWVSLFGVIIFGKWFFLQNCVSGFELLPNILQGM